MYTIEQFADILFAKIQNNHLDIEIFDEKITPLIGQSIYVQYGSDGLFKTMRLLSERALYSNDERTSLYFTYLRELECKWSGITDDFQA